MKRIAAFMAAFICLTSLATAQDQQYTLGDTTFFYSERITYFDSVKLPMKPADRSGVVRVELRTMKGVILAAGGHNATDSSTWPTLRNFCAGPRTAFEFDIKKTDSTITRIYIVCLFAPTQEPEEKSRGFSAVTDQDLLAGKKFNQDRNYTMGVGFEFFGPKVDKWSPLAFFRSLFDGASDLIHAKKHMPLYVQHASAFGCTGFTPEALGDTGIVYNDRPFSSIFFFTSRKTNAYSDDDAMLLPYSVTSELNVGVMGTSVPREVQSYIHAHHWAGSTRPIPKGWDHQIAFGGRLAGMYHLGMSFLLADNNRFFKCRKANSIRSGHRWIQWSGSADLMAGYYTNVAVATTLRFGWFRTPYWQNNNLLLIASQANKTGRRCPLLKNWARDKNIAHTDLFVFVSVRERFVVYNALLTGWGPRVSNTYQLDPSQVQPLISEFEWGVTFRYYKVALTYKPRVFRTHEFNTTPEFKRTHYYGTVALTINL